MKIQSSPSSLYVKEHAALSDDIAEFLTGLAKKVIPEVLSQYKSIRKSVLHGALLKTDPVEFNPDKIPLESFDAFATETILPVTEKVFATAGEWALNQLADMIISQLETADEEPKNEEEKQVVIESITKQVNQDAVDYAKHRAGELVTQITDSTRTMVAETVASALQDNLDSYGLADRLATSKAFSPQRADLIASYELGTASEAGNLAAWKRSGVVKGKIWRTSSDEIVSDVCTVNAEQGEVPIEDEFPSGDKHPLAHPHCRCTMSAVTKGSKIGKMEFAAHLSKVHK